MVDGQAGKGSKYRPVDSKKYAKNWERAFANTRLVRKKLKKRRVNNE